MGVLVVAQRRLHLDGLRVDRVLLGVGDLDVPADLVAEVEERAVGRQVSSSTAGRVLPTVIGTVVVPVLSAGSVTVRRASNDAVSV